MYMLCKSGAAQQSAHLTLGILRRPKHYLRSQANPRPKSILPPPSAGNASRYPGEERGERAMERCAPLFEMARLGWRTCVSYEPALEALDWDAWILSNC